MIHVDSVCVSVLFVKIISLGIGHYGEGGGGQVKFHTHWYEKKKSGRGAKKCEREDTKGTSFYVGH